jgi:16S rRNA C967 or C1407 C5-methylase (RsmB/RsmF family)
MGKSRPAIVLKGAKHGIEVDLVAGPGQKSTAIVTAEVVT